MAELIDQEAGLSAARGRFPYIPSGLQFQWHVTDRCNLRCAHCYQEGYSGRDLSFDELLRILAQYRGLLAAWRSAAGRPVRGHVTVTGGEPFARRDFLDLLEVLAGHRSDFSFAILTNGTLVDEPMADRLAALRPAYVQVSVEGTPATHDSIRGRGSYERTTAAVRSLVRARVRVFISFTAHRGNYREFSDVARLGQRLGASRVWADRLIPEGSGSALGGQVLTPRETRELVELMAGCQPRGLGRLTSRTEISAHRALQFLAAGGRPYRCQAGDRLITVLSNGDLCPCRRMPIVVGNLLTGSLEELYYRSPVFGELRDRERVSAGCEGCFYARLCRGGLKCLSYAITGDPFTADPGCWRARDRADPGRPASAGCRASPS